MASGPHWNAQRGTWSIQYWDGKWHRVVVVKKRQGWETADGRPRSVPPFAKAEKDRFAKIEESARRMRATGMPGTIEQFLCDNLSEYANVVTRAAVKVTYDQFIAWCQSNNLIMFVQVTSPVCRQWIVYSGKSLRVTTLRTRRAHLAAAWNKASKIHEIKNVWDVIDVPGKPEIKKRGAWSKDEFAILLPFCRPWLRDVLILGVNTGLRINALMNLRWDHIDLTPTKDPRDNGFVVVPPELDKAKKGYSVPINGQLHSLLIELRLKRGGDFVLAGQSGRPLAYSSSTGQAIIRACVRAGLKKPDSPNHHMRRTFGRWAHFGDLIPGRPMPLFTVMAFLGHSTPAMTMKYLDITKEDMAKCMRESD